MARHACGIISCGEDARWVLTVPVEGVAITYVCSAHWSALKVKHPEFAYLYSPIAALPPDFVLPAETMTLDGDPARAVTSTGTILEADAEGAQQAAPA